MGKEISIARKYNMHQKSVINGLILAGGRSKRMGFDKAWINYHGKPQVQNLFEILSSLCKRVFISCKLNQTNEFKYLGPVIPDATEVTGPAAALLSAFKFDPDSSWLVVACDLPFINRAGLQKLIVERDPSKVATVYINPDNNLPEPLIGIWEPKAVKMIESYVQQVITCPRKMLIQSDVKLLVPDHTMLIANINTPEEYKKAKSRLRINSQG